jgi:DNA-binding SARP family transcriptional activator/tetratricopeptide (TPR) repeat protein
MQGIRDPPRLDDDNTRTFGSQVGSARVHAGGVKQVESQAHPLAAGLPLGKGSSTDRYCSTRHVPGGSGLANSPESGTAGWYVVGVPRRRLRVLGGVELDGARITSSVAASLLAYLAVNGPRPLPREQVAFALWPDRSEDRARRALSDAMYRLRGALPDGAPWLVASADEVGFDGIEVDVWRFRELAYSDDDDDQLEAVELHHGPLADGVDDEWVELPRRAHHEALTTLCERAAVRLAPAVRLAVAERWVELDPYGVESHHCLVETLLALDRRDAARRAVDRYRVVLDELNLEDADIDRWVALTTDTDAAIVPFVGRLDERARLVRALDDACDAAGGVVVVVGDAGIGKSRLLDELAEAARWRGVDVVRAGAEEFVSPRPLAPLDAALAVVLDKTRAEQARRHLASDVVRTLTTIVPDLGVSGPSDTSPLDAVDATLSWLAMIGPHLVLLDDAHWAGADFWPAVAELAPRLRDRRVLLVVAARRAELLDRGLRRTIGELEAGGAPIVQLTGLSTGEVDQLLRATGASVDAEVVHARAGGNPLLALAWGDDAGGDTLGMEVVHLHQLERSGHDVSRLAAGTHRRFERLDEPARRVVRQAAVLGRTVDYRVLAAASASDVGDVFQHVLDAERAGLLSRRAGRMAFDHDLVRSAVLAAVDAGELRELHARALDAVALVQPDDSLRLLGHAEAAGAKPAVVAYAIAAGTDALLQSSYRVAEEHFSRAIELLDTLDDPLARHAALGGRVRARDRLADRVGQGRDVSQLLAAAEAVGGSLLEEALLLDAEHRFAIGDLDGTLAAVERAAGAPVTRWTTAATMPGSTQLARMASLTLRELGRYDEAERLGALLLDRLEADGEDYDAALITDVLGGIAWRRGEPRLAAELHQRAADRFAELGARGAEARALNNVGTALWALGDDRGAEVVHRRALDVCRSLEDRRGEGDNLDNLGGVSFARGDFRAAIELYASALAIRRATDDPWGVSISLSNMGDAYRALGEHGRALELIEESIAVNEAAGVVRNEATTRQSRGLVLMDLGRLDDALDELLAAERMHRELGDRANLLEVRSALLDLLVAVGRPSEVSAAVADLDADVSLDDAPRSREVVYVALAGAATFLGDVAAARRHAAGAARALDDALDGLPRADAAIRRSAVPLHHAAASVVQRFSRFVDVAVAPAGDLLGAAGGPVTVRWTLERPDDLMISDLPTRRRHVLVRLAREAAEADAAPTDLELATALGVSRRTVLRDVEILRSAGQHIATRGRSSPA